MSKPSSKPIFFGSLNPLALASILTLFLTFLAFTTHVEARCCARNDSNLCLDGTIVHGWCCGHGSCNIFCCSCDGGCLGSPRTTKPHNGLSDVVFERSTQYQVCTAASGASIFSGDEDCGAQLFRMLDVDGLGKLSVGQYLSWYKGLGDAGDGAGETNENDVEDEWLIGAREYFLRFDANGDGFVDEEEMHRAVGV